MIWKGRSYRRSKTLCAREATDDDFYVSGEQVKGNGVVIVRYKDCPVTRTEVIDGITVSYREPKGVKCIPLSFHTYTYMPHSAVKNESIWYYRHVYLVEGGNVYTRRVYFHEVELEWAFAKDKGIYMPRPDVEEYMEGKLK